MIKKYIFDSSNPYFSNDNKYNYLYLKSRETFFNDYDLTCGFTPFYEVLKGLGFKPEISDLLYILDNSEGYISFGLYGQEPKRTGRPRKRYVLTFYVKSIIEKD